MFDELEKWRIACAEWLDLQEAADILEDTKNDVFAEVCSDMDAKSEAEKQRLARVSDRWKQHRHEVTTATNKARRAKFRMKYADMAFEAKRSENANARAEFGKHRST